MIDALHFPTAGSPGCDTMRMCVACRGRSAIVDLVRIVAIGGTAVPDPRRRLPGRGASLHPTKQCLDRAERTRALPRALRVAGPLDLAEVRAFVANHDRR